MRTRILNGCLVVLLALSYRAWSQDDDHVVPAHEEPRHVPKLSNDWVRIIDVEIPEGGRTLYHAHSLDYPYVMISSVTLDNQVYGQQPKEVKIERGLVGYYRASTQGTYTHRFINRGPGVFRAIGIELLQPLQPSARVNDPLPEMPGLKTVLDTERVRAYRIELAPGQTLGPITIPGPSIRIAMTGGRISEKWDGGAEAMIDLAPAQFVFRGRAATTLIRNEGDRAVELVEFELK
jgi:hypothetical protein